MSGLEGAGSPTRGSEAIASTETPGREGAGRLDREAGLTLVELLVTLVIMGIAIGALLTGFGVSIKQSVDHRHHASIETVLRQAAEQFEAHDIAYAACPGASYSDPAPVSGYTIHIAQVAYWDKVKNPAGFGSTCPGGADPGLQRLTLLVSSADGHVSQQLDVLVRQP